MSVEQKAVELLDKIENVIVNYTPEVYETAVNVVWVDAIGSFAYTLACFLFCFLFVLLAYKMHNIFDKFVIEIVEVLPVFRTVFGCISLIAFVEGVDGLLDAWMWIGIFNPELALAHKVMGL